MRLSHLLKSSEEDLENLSIVNKALAVNLVEQPKIIELLKLNLVKKKCDKKRTVESEEQLQVIKVREEKIKELSMVIQADKIHVNHAAQDKHLDPTAVRPPIFAWLLGRRLLPSLYTPTPLGRGSSHAPV